MTTLRHHNITPKLTQQRQFKAQPQQQLMSSVPCPQDPVAYSGVAPTQAPVLVSLGRASRFAHSQQRLDQNARSWQVILSPQRS